MSLLELFCEVDDFIQVFDAVYGQQQLCSGRKRGRKASLSKSEIITILIVFHQKSYRHFKAYYNDYVLTTLKSEFPKLVSYNRFVELSSTVMLEMCAYLKSRYGRCTGISFVDSTSIAVCHNKRINRHKVFKDDAHRSKTTMGWFYGFKIHLIVNDAGELLETQLTPGNTDDRVALEDMVESIYGKVFGDKGYISQPLFERLRQKNIELITTIKKNMKNQLMHLEDKLLLRKRYIVETIIDQLKNISQIEHTRHRSPANFVTNLLAGLIAYTHQPKKPSLNLFGDSDVPVLL